MSGTGGTGSSGLGQKRESTLPRTVPGASVDTTSLRRLGVGGSMKLVRADAGDDGAIDSVPSGTVWMVDAYNDRRMSSTDGGGGGAEPAAAATAGLPKLIRREKGRVVSSLTSRLCRSMRRRRITRYTTTATASTIMGTSTAGMTMNEMFRRGPADCVGPGMGKL